MPVVSRPIIPATIEAPVLALPSIIVVTPVEAQYYLDACEAYESVGQEDAEDEEELQQRYAGLSRSAACEWAIYGFSVQGWLNLESQFNEISTYTKALRARIETLENMLLDQYESAQKQQQVFEDINKND